MRPPAGGATPTACRGLSGTYSRVTRMSRARPQTRNRRPIMTETGTGPSWAGEARAAGWLPPDGTAREQADAHYKRLFALQGQARDLGRGIITCGGHAGRSHYGAVIATYPQGSRIANRDSWRCHHDHPDDVSALECALQEVQRLPGKGRFDVGAPQPTTSYEPCSAGPDCRDEFCRRDWARLVQ